MDGERTRGTQRGSAPNRRAFWEEWAREARKRGKVPRLPHGLNCEYLNVPFCNGVTPLIMAIRLRQYRACVRMVCKGADIDLHDLEGKTPLIHAVETKQSDIVEFLLHKGCNPNKPDATGRSPLMYASYMGMKEIMQAILSAGGDPTASDTDGRVVTDYVKHRRDAGDAWRLIKELNLPSGGGFSASRRATMRKHRFSHVVPEYIDYLNAKRTVGRRFVTHFARFTALLLLCDAIIAGAAISRNQNVELLMYVSYGLLVSLAFFKAWSTVSYCDLVLFPKNTFGRFVPSFKRSGANGRRGAEEHRSAARAPSFEEQARQPTGFLREARALSNAFRFATRNVALVASLRMPGVKRESSAAKRRLGVLTVAWLGLVFTALCAAAAIWIDAWWPYYPGALIGPEWWRSYPEAGAVLMAFALVYYLLLLPSVSITRARLLDAQRRRGDAASRFKDRTFGESAAPDSSGSPFALYLRSFRQDDTLLVAGVDFEAVLVHAIGQLCEVVAVGGHDGRFGAARVTVADSQWQHAVVELAEKAQIIFIIPFDTPGIIWEIKWLVASGMSEKTVFIMPPSSFVVADASHGPIQPAEPQSFNEAWRRMVTHEDLQQFEIPGYNRQGCLFTLDAGGKLRDWDALGMELLPWVLAPILSGGEGLPDTGPPSNVGEPGSQMPYQAALEDLISGIDLIDSNPGTDGWGVDAGGASDSGRNAGDGGGDGGGG
jgi:hypothetical protein